MPLPLDDAGLDAVQAYARAHGLTHNVYHAIATREDAKSGRLDNCLELLALYIGIDFKHGVPLLDIWTALKTFALSPSFIVHSGGELHVYWRLAEPIDLTTDVGLTRAYQWRADLAHRLGGEPESTEPARVLRLPDTLNLKSDYGSTPPAVTLLCSDATAAYTLDEVIAILGDADPNRPSASVVASPPSIIHCLDRALRIKLARAWLERQRPAIDGQGGDKHTYQICCGVAIGHDLDEDDAFEALRDWNARCEPPWSERELRQKIRNAIKYGKSQRGAKLIEFPTTEVGDAECFAERYADIVRYDHRQGRWLLGNNVGLWEPDPVERLNQMVVVIMRERQQRALDIADTKRREKFLKWAIAGESWSRINNTLALARSVPPLNDRGDNWDPDPMLLGAPNGVVDLRTGALRVATPDDRVTMRVRVPYDASVACPLWEKTVAEIFDGDADLIAFAQRALGYSLTGDCREECFFLCWGGGANGEGTMMNTFARTVGDYADNLPFSSFQLQDRASSIPSDIAKLVGKRFVAASESNEQVRLNEARVKALTGRDPITARFMYRDFFTFEPVAEFWLASNTKPTVSDSSEGFWRWVHLIPFTQSFEGREDRELKDKLRAEAAGILAWAVRGALAWQCNGLNPPDAVRAATEDYRRESDQLERWIEARCEIRPDDRLQAGRAFTDYDQWCTRRHETRDLNIKTFGQRMKLRFPHDQTKKRNTVYQGIVLVSAPMF